MKQLLDMYVYRKPVTVSLTFIFIFSSKTMEERYEHKTHVHVQEMVRPSKVSLICELTSVEMAFLCQYKKFMLMLSG